MLDKHGVDIPPAAQVERPAEGTLIPVDKSASEKKAVVTSRQVHALMAYYVTLLIGAIAVIVLIIVKGGSPLDASTASSRDSVGLLASMTFLVSGAIVGSVLYQIRMLFRFYIKAPYFDSRWLAKYYSAPVEAAGLALAIVSLIESGAVVLGGQGFDFSKGKPFAAFGIGALVGFGIREVVGWLGSVAKTVFPTDYKNVETTPQSSEPRSR